MLLQKKNKSFLVSGAEISENSNGTRHLEARYMYQYEMYLYDTMFKLAPPL